MTYKPGHKIQAIHIIMVADEQDGTEGIMAFMDPLTRHWMPLVASDHIRLEQIYRSAEIICRQFGKEFRVLKFTDRQDVTDQIKETFKK